MKNEARLQLKLLELKNLENKSKTIDNYNLNVIRNTTRIFPDELHINLKILGNFYSNAPKTEKMSMKTVGILDQLVHGTTFISDLSVSYYFAKEYFGKLANEIYLENKEEIIKNLADSFTWFQTTAQPSLLLELAAKIGKKQASAMYVKLQYESMIAMQRNDFNYAEDTRFALLRDHIRLQDEFINGVQEYSFPSAHYLTDQNLINTEMIQLLKRGRVDRKPTPKGTKIEKMPKGFYIVAFTKIDDNYIYSYKNYNVIFTDLFNNYVVHQSKCPLYTDKPLSECGSLGANTLFVVKTEKDISRDSVAPVGQNNKVDKNFLRTFVGLSKNKLRGLPALMEQQEIIKLITLLGEKKSEKAFKMFSDVSKSYGNDIDPTLWAKVKFPENDSLSKVIICTDDLQSLVNEFKNRGHNINQGVQSHRGELNDLQHIVSCIDINFRDCMYAHYYHHYSEMVKNYSHPDNLQHHHFNFNNIHNNIGYVGKYL